METVFLRGFATSAALIVAIGAQNAFVLRQGLQRAHVLPVVLLGSIASQEPEGARAVFGAGAASASAVWFFALGYGARVLAPLFERPAAWRVLDGAIALVMWAIAASLIYPR